MFDLHTFVNLVRNMRNSQKEYFKTRDWNVLHDSKENEKLVDKAIEKYDEEQARLNGSSKQNDLPF